MDKRNIRGLLIVFLSFIINLIGGIINMFVSGNTAGTIVSAIVVIVSLGFSIYGLSQLTGFSEHFRKARAITYIYLGAELATLIGSSIISSNVAASTASFNIGGYVGSYYALVAYTIIFAAVNAALNIFYITEILSGCMDIARDNNAPLEFSRIFLLRRWYAISLTITVACQILILLITVSAISGAFASYMTYGTATNPVASGFLVFFSIIEIIAGIIYIVSYIRILMTIYKTYNSNKSIN